MAKKKKTGLGYLFWFAFVLLVIFLYLASYKIAGDKIKNFKITDIFKNRVKSDTPEVVMNIEEENVSDPPGQDESNNLPFSETEIIESQKDNETVTQGLTPPDNEDETMRHPDADNVGNPITEQESQDIKTRKVHSTENGQDLTIESNASLILGSTQSSKAIYIGTTQGAGHQAASVNVMRIM